MSEHSEETSTVKIIYVVQPLPDNLKEVYAIKPVSIAGLILIFCGVITLICGGIELLYWTDVGIFLLFLLTGIIALVGAKKASKCLVIFTMVITIISALAATYGIYFGIDIVKTEVKVCEKIKELVGDMKMDTPYFVNKETANYTDWSAYEAFFGDDFKVDYDASLCDLNNPETGVNGVNGYINGTYIHSSHPCLVKICSRLHLAATALFLVSSLVALVTSVFISSLSCRATCCYTPPPAAAQHNVVFNKEQSLEYEAELGQYKEF